MRGGWLAVCVRGCRRLVLVLVGVVGRWSGRGLLPGVGLML